MHNGVDGNDAHMLVALVMMKHDIGGNVDRC